MGKGKEGSPTYMYIEIYTQLEGGGKTMINTDTCVSLQTRVRRPEVPASDNEVLSIDGDYVENGI